MGILIVAEHDNCRLKSATLNAVCAAALIAENGGGDLTILVVGEGCQAVADQAAKVAGVSKVLLADSAACGHQLAENVAPLVADLAKSGGYSHVLAPATTCGKNLLPRVAALLDVGQLSDIVAVEGVDTFKRPIYAGNAIATVKSLDAIQVISVRGTAFDAVAAVGGEAVIEVMGAVHDVGISRWIGEDVVRSGRPDLTSSPVVIAGGRGMGSGENFALIEKVADKLGAAVGASRAAVDAGFAPNDMQVGQTGKIVAPDLYIAVGISGAIQHLAGMKDSRVIVAINKDADAAIFQVADYGLEADLFEAVPALQAAL